MIKQSMICFAMVVFGVSVVASEEVYNILAIDGGGIRGIIPAGILLKVEKFAYTYCKEKGYTVPVYKNPNDPTKNLELVHLQDVFEMFAGTSTGSIIAAALAYPHPDDKGKQEQRPWYFMQEILEIYTKTGDQIFVASRSDTLGNLFIFVLFITMCTTIGYLLNFKYVDHEADLRKMEEVRSMSQGTKLSRKEKSENMSKLRTLTEQLLVSKLDDQINTNEELALVDDIKFTEHEEQYENKKKQTYYKLVGYFFAGLITAIIVQKVYAKLSKPKYNRKSLENIMEERLGAYKISDAMSDELLITAYDYNSQEARFYSKYMAKQEPMIYDVPIGNATGASSAAPTFFDPKQQINGYGLKELQIDGGIICNNPALYAYQFAKIFNKKTKTRILSLGTGENPFKTLTSKYGWDKKSYGLYKSEFMMNMDNYAAEYYLKNEFAFQGRPKDFLRVQKYATKIPMDDISKSNLDLLEKTGSDLYDEEKESIEAFIKTILDEKYGKATEKPKEKPEDKK